MEVYVLTVLDNVNDIHSVTVYDNYNKAINEIENDLKDRNHFNEDNPYISETDLNEIIELMKEDIDKQGMWSDDTVYYIVDRREVR